MSSSAATERSKAQCSRMSAIHAEKEDRAEAHRIVLQNQSKKKRVSYSYDMKEAGGDHCANDVDMNDVWPTAHSDEAHDDDMGDFVQEEADEEEGYWPSSQDGTGTSTPSESSSLDSSTHSFDEPVRKAESCDYEPDKDGFNIMKLVMNSMRERMAFRLATDDSDLLHERSTYTKGDFARSLLTCFSRHGISDTAEVDILALLASHLPAVRFPIRESRRGNGNAMSDRRTYCPPMGRTLALDMCERKSCCIFLGSYKNLDACPICGDHRYTKCSETSCRNKEYEDCNHSRQSRVAKKQAFYRPITATVVSLLMTPDFVDALDYNFVKPAATAPYKYCDLMDGGHAIYHMRMMSERFQAWTQWKNDRPRVQISLLLSEFYDGAQIFRHRTSDFWPLMVSILNVFPTYREKLGVGE
jgi:hypothetical protein